MRSSQKEGSLQIIPGVGPSIAQDLQDLGYGVVSDLCNEDPENMYSRLNQIRGERQDPCVLYVFRCAVYFASCEAPEPELLKWWAWKDRRLKSPPPLLRGGIVQAQTGRLKSK
jgi:hypothetical protein